MGENDLLKRIMYLEDHLHQVEVKNKRLINALERIVEWGPLGGAYSDLAAASAFQRISREALEGNHD